MIVEHAAKRTLGAFAARDLILLGCQLLAPLGISLHHFGRWSRREQLSFVVENAHVNQIRRCHGIGL